MKTHELKTWPVFYKDIISGVKTFEVRVNDRNFQLGDTLFLREYDPDVEDYTGRSFKVRVTYILGDNPFFQLNNTVIMGIASLADHTEKENKVITAEGIKQNRVINRAIAFIEKFTEATELHHHIVDELKSIRESELASLESQPIPEETKTTHDGLNDQSVDGNYDIHVPMSINKTIKGKMFLNANQSPEQGEKKSAEESNVKMQANRILFCLYEAVKNNEPIEIEKEIIRNGLEEFAQQFKKQAKVTDEEIEQQIIECGLSKVPEGQQYWEGAKWMRDKLSK